jgi:flagellar motor switch protein FliN/FliY
MLWVCAIFALPWGKVRDGDMLDQSDIDRLLASATALADETAERKAPAPSRPPIRKRSLQVSPELDRLLKIRVPVIVRLSDRKMNFDEVLNLTVGSIIEFDRSSDSDLDLVVGNRQIGIGQAVKVGENFGLKVTRIQQVADRIQAMGEQV